MHYHYLLTLATLGLASALPQEAAGQSAQGSQGRQAGGAEAAPGQPGGVPMDLAGGFKPDQISMQLSFTGDPSEGLQSGAKVQQADTMKVPKFALGDSSGINTQAKWVIMMVDTTSQQQRMLHYVKSDYMTDGQKTEIASQKEPKMQYMAPGMLGEQGQGRQYTFLMYQQKGDFAGTGMPQPGQPVVMQDFVKANGLDKAIAGTNVQVDVQSMGNMGGQMSSGMPMASGQPMPAGAGGQLIEGGQSMSMAMASGSAMTMMMSGGGGDAPAPTPAAPDAAGAAGTGAAAPAAATGGEPAQPSDMAGGSGMMMNGSMPMGASPSAPAPAAASASSGSPATGDASAMHMPGSVALALGAVGFAAVALF